jgi:RHS repeat-associated protein
LLNENGVTYQLPCQFIDQHTLQANLPSEVRSHPGMFSIWVENPAPAGGSSNSVDFQVLNIIKIEIASPENGSDLASNEVEVGGTALSGYEITEITVNGVVAAYEDGAFHATVGLVAGENTLTAIVRDAGGDTATNSITVNYTPKNQVPDPTEVAPPLDPTVATDMAAATEFLYTGSNPIQTGVAPGTIEARRVAVLRGKVMTRDGEPLAGVAITVLNHSEYGRTFTRHDGMFDLAVNGGGLITLNYDKDGYLPIQRQVQAPWKDYAWAPDAAMIPVDPKVTTIDLGAAGAVQVARGSTVADGDGTRQTALLFTPGTSAEMVLPDGSTQPLTTINVRATEYTVGENGPKAMPGELPPASGYTYCVELSADEALAAGAKEVRFDRPVYFYVDNFIGFPVGGIVPVGWYDREKAAWIPSENGRVIKVLAVAGGFAALDVTGSGQPADAAALAALGITDEERREIAALYEPGKSLWRVAMTHFTPWDCNWPYGPPDDAQPPPSDPPQPDDQDKPDDPTECPGCVIEAESQVLGESIPIAGTPYSLNYRSDRVPGYAAGRTVEIPLSGPEVPASLERIDLEIQVAGQVHRTSFSPAPNRRTTFVWDGKDGLGRPVRGAIKLSYRLRFVYQVVYLKAANFAAAFGQAGTGAIGGNRAAAEVYFSREHSVMLIADIAGLSGIGGWSLDPHHVYSLSDKILYQGDGTRHTASGFVDIIETVAGTGDYGYSGDGGPATAAGLASPRGIALGPDGSLYIADLANHRIRRVGPDGIITTVAGTGSSGYSGDGGPATAARLNYPFGIALGPDGSLYIADTYNKRIRRVGPDGIITTVAGTGVWGYSGDGGPATAAGLASPRGIALGPDGSLYIADLANDRIRRVGQDGIITTVAGKGGYGYYGASGYSGDGGPATAARLNYPFGIALGPDGSLYIADHYNHRIRRVGQDGIITTVAGTGSSGYSGDGGLATAAQLYFPYGIAFGPDGSLYIADHGNHRIRRVGRKARSLVAGETMVPSADDSEYHVFNVSGRHLRTLDSVTGAVRRAFTYDDQGYLVRLEDRDGNATRIERDSAGAPLAIIAPDGQRTELALDANGYLASVANPAGETFHLAYTSGGLLTKVTKPNGAEYAYSYNTAGRLTRESRPDGGGWTLSRTETENGFGGMMTSAEGRISRFDVERLSGTELLRTSTAPDGTAATRLITTTETGITEVVNAADGTVRTLRKVADPRVGMNAPFVAESTVTTPGGISLSITSTRDANLSYRNDPFSFTTLSESTSVNGRTSTAGYSEASSTWTGASPQGRINVVQIDANGRPVFTRPADLNASRYAYDTRGRLTGITTGEGAEARTVAFVYDPLGNLARITDALGQATNFEYDLAGRVTAQTMPDGRTVRYTYDPNGNLAGVMPPGREAHLFAYTSTDLAEQYDPPDLDGISTITRYTYNRDKQLTAIERPDGQAVTMGYDAGGRLAKMSMGSGTYLYGYSPATGKLAGITAPDGNTLAYTYDGFLPLSESWAGEISGTVSRAYDNNFWLKSLSVNGQAVNYGYDNDGLLIQAGTETLQRNALNGLLTGTTLDAVSTSQDYNGFGEMETFTVARNEMDIFNTQFTRDAKGRITEKVEIIEGTTTTYGYVYDDAGRLVEVTENGATISQYTYDDNGNRLSRTAGGATISGTYDAQDRMIGYDGATYEYTANGELLRKTEGSQVTAYNYDVLGNLMAVDLPDGRMIEYLIDGNNRRIGKKIDSTLVQGFLYQDSLNPIAELDASGSVVSRFVYGSRANVPDYMVKGGVTYRIIADHLGSPRLVVDTATGDIIQRMNYDEFGNVLTDTNPGFQPFGFAGGHYDVDTGLVRFGARDYDPQTGRWTAKDPILFAGGDTNLFGYVQNDPVNFVDPMGLERWPKPGARHTVGRPGTIVPPGGKIGTAIEKHVASGWEFGKKHDKFVDKAKQCKIPDPIINIPSMVPVYLYSVIKDNSEMSVEDRPEYFPIINIEW